MALIAAGTVALGQTTAPAPNPGANQAGAPVSAPAVERQTVRRIQVDVSVIDPASDAAWKSVPNLPRDGFILTLDGSPLPPDVAHRVEFDPIDLAADQAGAGALADDPLVMDRPTLIVVADLNFLDSSTRRSVADALDELATLAETRPLRVKVIALGKRLLQLTPDFTSQPQAIRLAAQELRDIISPGPSPSRPVSMLSSTTAREDRTVLPDLDTMQGEDLPGSTGRPAAFAVSRELQLTGGMGASLEASGSSATLDLVRRNVDPRPSLTALEAVMIAHAGIPGRKALLLFSSADFDLNEDLWLSYVLGTKKAAQAGFNIWGIDALGLAGTTSAPRSSKLLSHLALSTGGGFVHAASRLAVAFDEALDQLSTYYLFSVPVAAPRRAAEEHYIDVRLDTTTHPEWWDYRVRSNTSVTVYGPDEQRLRRRLAALVDPQGFRLPEVRVTAAYPSGRRRLSVPVEVSTALSDLTFQFDAARRDYVARIGWEGILTDAKGRKVCRLGDGAERLIRAVEPPTRLPPALIVLRTYCDLPRTGIYDVRVVVEDVTTGDVGAATTRLEVPQPTKDLATVSALRLGRNSGRDFLVDLAAKGRAGIGRDRARDAFIPLASSETLAPSDRTILRYVTCGTTDPWPAVVYRHRERTPATGDATGASALPPYEALFQVLSNARGEQQGRHLACREFEAIVPENTLTPGTYGIALLDRGADLQHLRVEDLLARQTGIVASIEFRVQSPTKPPPPIDPDQHAKAERASDPPCS